MSQHYFQTIYGSRPVCVTLGWDRPLHEYFMLIEYDDGKGEADPEVLYTYLRDHQRSLEDYRQTLVELGLNVPETMFDEVSRDRASNVGNRIVSHN